MGKRFSQKSENIFMDELKLMNIITRVKTMKNNIQSMFNRINEIYKNLNDMEYELWEIINK